MFRKYTEDFICEKCGATVTGDGYTNHCPTCLWSKHVDVTPGDRAATCGGLMKPCKLENEGGEFIISHRCEMCAHEKRNRTHPTDNFDEIVKISQKVER